jgi:hypothetical protein
LDLKVYIAAELLVNSDYEKRCKKTLSGVAEKDGLDDLVPVYDTRGAI